RIRPRLIYVTDGGGSGRVRETQHGLARLGLAEGADFLNYSETSLYDALLDGNLALFREVAERVRERLDALEPQQLFCDAVEFSNPLHDMTLPIVRAAVSSRAHARLFEVPLVYQRVGARESYEVQRMPPSRRLGQVAVRLTERELSAKLSARDHGYDLLQQRIGPVIATLTNEHLSTEVVAPAPQGLPTPSADCVLRY